MARRKVEDASSQRVADARARLAAYLKQKGLRATRQRDVVLDTFLREGAHVSVDELCGRIRRTNPSIGHATVYRSMSLFVEAGIAKERRFHEGRVRYEAGMDVGHHDHLVCLACGGIQEFEDPTIEKLQQDIAGRRGFRVTYHRLELYGLCADCQD
ncbi:MAG: Fur family transcriptional regulator [Deferrisomatales bacterium]|nr:Fur family transcriptional regulator [Deferrisomatales bacterium]